MCATSHDRLVSETLEEREARLQHVCDRPSSETAEERKARLHCLRSPHNVLHLPSYFTCTVAIKCRILHSTVR